MLLITRFDPEARNIMHEDSHNHLRLLWQVGLDLTFGQATSIYGQ